MNAGHWLGNITLMWPTMSQMATVVLDFPEVMTGFSSAAGSFLVQQQNNCACIAKSCGTTDILHNLPLSKLWFWFLMQIQQQQIWQNCTYVLKKKPDQSQTVQYFFF